MKPNSRFFGRDRAFWAHIRLLSERLGYSTKKSVRKYTLNEIVVCLHDNGLSTGHVWDQDARRPTEYGALLLDYLNFRSSTLENDIRPYLMNRDEAKQEFERLQKERKS